MSLEHVSGRTPQRSNWGAGQSPEVCGKSVLKVSAQSTSAKGFPIAAVGFFRSLWEKPIWEGVWPYLNPINSFCLRTASIEWNVPGKYGPHGELFCFLIQKEPAIAPNSETFSPFIDPGIRLPCFSEDVLKKCAFIALHVMAEEVRDGDGFQVPQLGAKWKNGLPKESKVGE